ncbi:hypothetical protein MN0502_34340 (plasmid) [Arthrobacter sp. MN05-02]|nr:hypothetical protein MN0502_34340 [Arthrobacter sp. MN05-02]
MNDLNLDVPKLEQWVALTFSGKANDGDRAPERSVEELVADVKSLLQGFKEELEDVGAGNVSLMRAADLTDQTYVAFNPRAAAAVERARLSGAGTGLTWHEVGPSAARTIGYPGRYDHAGVTSKSWQMFKPPAGTFRENALVALLGPDASMLQKRVTVFYRPQPPEKSAQQVAQALTNAQFATNQKGRRPTSSQIIALSRRHARPSGNKPKERHSCASPSASPRRLRARSNCRLSRRKSCGTPPPVSRSGCGRVTTTTTPRSPSTSGSGSSLSTWPPSPPTSGRPCNVRL